jgi:Xaa-Pro aminopeptidase
VSILDRTRALMQKAFQEKSFDGFLIMDEANLLYFTGLQGATCLLVPKKGESTVFVYGTNYEQVKADTKGFKVELLKRGDKLTAKIAAQAKTFRISKLAVDTISYESYRSLAKELRRQATLKVQSNLVWDLRKVKDEKELELMRNAAELTNAGMQVAYETVKPGMKEIEVAAEIEYTMRRKGGWGTAFDTIVSSGVRSAFPHGGCTSKEIRRDDLVVVDIGAKYQHYCSDMTRTLVAGKPSAKQRKLFETVKLAEEKAFQAIKPKAKAKDVDALARKVIEQAGYGEYFVHSLGHGVGLEVHESPTLSPASKDTLMINNVVADEPGIYIVGFGGMRIEDSVLVRKQGSEKLTKGLYYLEPER